MKRVHFTQQQSKNYYDKNHHVILHNIKVEDKVRIEVQLKCHKFKPDWFELQEVIAVYNNNSTVRPSNG